MNLTKIWILLLFFYSFSSAQTTYWWNDAVFYEIFVRSYYDSDGNGIGDFKGLLQKLDYLNDGNDSTSTDLGVTAIWLMPVTQSPSYHGYDVIDYKKIEQDYGNNQDFQNFLDSAHARGIKVIIDLVLNHSSSNHPWFTDSKIGPSAPHRDWYRWSSTNPNISGPWGQKVWHSANGYYYYGLFNSGMPDLNYESQQVKDEVADIIKYWLDTVNVDGFRLDAIKYLYEDGNQLEDVPATFEYLREFRTINKNINPDAVSVGEVWSNTSSILPYADGTGMDFCFEFETASYIISSINSGFPISLSNHLKNAVTPNYPFLQYATFLTNHDQIRVFSQLLSNVNKCKLAAAILLTLPGIPFIYYGEEIGMISGSDDPSKRTPMQWTSSVNAGFTTGTPWRAIPPSFTNFNVETMSADSSSLLNWYKNLIQIRKDNASLRRGKYYYMNSSNQSVYVFARNENVNQEIIIPIHNFSGSSVNNPNFFRTGFSGLPIGSYKLTDIITNNDAGVLTIAGNGDINCTPEISIPSYGTAILKTDKLTDVGENYELNSFYLEQNYPNPFNPTTKISWQSPVSSWQTLKVYDVLGNEVTTLIDKEMEAGYHSVEFDASKLPSGVYFYRLKTEHFINTKMMLLLK
jgi:glycosidase